MMVMSNLLAKLNWRNVFEILVGVVGAAGVITGLVYAAGVDRTNLNRDVQTNTKDITKNRISIDSNTMCIQANRDEMQSQRAVLARIEEGVDWIKKDLERVK